MIPLRHAGAPLAPSSTGTPRPPAAPRARVAAPARSRGGRLRRLQVVAPPGLRERIVRELREGPRR